MGSPFKTIADVLADRIPPEFQYPTDFQERHGSWEWTAVRLGELHRYWSLSITPLSSIESERVAVESSAGIERGGRYYKVVLLEDEMLIGRSSLVGNLEVRKRQQRFFEHLLVSGISTVESMADGDLR